MFRVKRSDLGLEYTIYFSLRLTPFTSVSHSVLSSGFTFSATLQKMNAFSFTYLLVRNGVFCMDFLLLLYIIDLTLFPPKIPHFWQLKKIFSFIYFVPVLLFYLYNKFQSKSGTFVLLSIQKLSNYILVSQKYGVSSI